MNCESFGSCGSCTLGEPYEDQISYKKQLIGDKFREFFYGEFEFFCLAAAKLSYQGRIWHLARYLA